MTSPTRLASQCDSLISCPTVHKSPHTDETGVDTVVETRRGRRHRRTHLVLVVVGDGEARGVLGLGPLAERGEHAPDEAALVPAQVEPGDRGRQQRRREEGDDTAARRHRGEGRANLLRVRALVGSASACGAWLLLCACASRWCQLSRWAGGAERKAKGKRGGGGRLAWRGTATRDPIGAVSALGSGGGWSPTRKSLCRCPALLEARDRGKATRERDRAVAFV